MRSKRRVDGQIGRCRLATVASLVLALLVAPCVVPSLSLSARGAGTYRIHGKVVCGLFGFGISGVKMYGLPGDPKTDGSGRYSATVPEGWSGVVYPRRGGLHFDPFIRKYENVTEDIEDNYKTTLPKPIVSGRVRTPEGQPIEGVTILGLPKTPVTNYHGFYLSYVSSGSSRTMTPQKPGYTFTPPQRAFNNISGDLDDQDFTGNGAPRVVVNPIAGLTTTEGGGSAQFEVALSAAPTANVTVPLASSDTTEGTVAPAELTFTPANWNTPQPVTVTGVDDPLRDGDVPYLVNVGPATSGDPNYNGVDPPDVAVTNQDDDTPGIAVNPTDGLTTTEAGGTAQFDVVLRGQPTADVNIPIASTDTSEGTVNPTNLVFTPANWNTPQAVTVTGVDDPDFDGDVPYTVNVGPATSADPGYNGLDAPDVDVVNLNDETPPELLVTPEDTFDFGTIEVGESAEQDVFIVANAGGGRLIGGVWAFPPFRIIDGQTFDLGPGEQQNVRVRFAPYRAKKFKGKVYFISTGGFAKRSLRGVGVLDTVVVDNLDNFPTKRFEVVSGNWQSEAVHPKMWATDYRITPTGDGSAVAAWHFRVKYHAMYEVSARWPKGLKTWAPDAPFRVYHANGSTIIPVRQNKKSGKWVRLGWFEFAPDADWRVELNNDAGGTHVVADAIRARWAWPLEDDEPPVEDLRMAITPDRGPGPLDVLCEVEGAPDGAKCKWDFGNGTKAKGPVAVCTYYSPGTYTVTVKVNKTVLTGTVTVE